MIEIDDIVERLLADVRKSRKYNRICSEAIINIGKKELSKRKYGQALKETKNRLHQIYGAYLSGRPRYDAWIEELRKARNEDEFQKICAEIMEHHSSTRERLGILDEFYRKIFSMIPSPRSMMDLACGLNPVSFPWMPVKGDVEYMAYDIHYDMVEFLNRFLKDFVGKGGAKTRDVLFNPPKKRADVAFMLKTIPCFDQIDKSLCQRLPEKINADYLIISFPTKSLGGRKRGMVENYTKRFLSLIQDKDWRTESIRFKSELVFIVEKRA